MRLIDADKLIYQSHAQHIQPYINKKDIDEQPTVEMAEDCASREVVLRPYWIDNLNGTISCSHCHTWFNKDERYPYMRYCPYCNVEMTESEDAE